MDSNVDPSSNPLALVVEKEKPFRPWHFKKGNKIGKGGPRPGAGRLPSFLAKYRCLADWVMPQSIQMAKEVLFIARNNESAKIRLNAYELLWKFSLPRPKDGPDHLTLIQNNTESKQSVATDILAEIKSAKSSQSQVAPPGESAPSNETPKNHSTLPVDAPEPPTAGE